MSKSDATQQECGAYYGTGHGATPDERVAICRRPAGHPEVADDGIGHSPQPVVADRRVQTERA